MQFYDGQDTQGRPIPSAEFRAAIRRHYSRLGLPFTDPDYWPTNGRAMDAAPPEQDPDTAWRERFEGRVGKYDALQKATDRLRGNTGVSWKEMDEAYSEILSIGDHEEAAQRTRALGRSTPVPNFTGDDLARFRRTRGMDGQPSETVERYLWLEQMTEACRGRDRRWEGR